MSTNKLRVGFVGAGFVNFGTADGRLPWDHASRLEKLGGVQVVGIADVFVDKAREVLQVRRQGARPELYEGCQVYASHLDMLKDAKLDVVIIGTAPVHRGSLDNSKDIELAFVKAGVHSFIEKPLSVVPPEQFNLYADELHKEGERKNVITSVGYMFRYHAAVRKMKELMTSHGGKVMAFNARYYLAYHTCDRAFWWDINKSGGPIVEQATHFLDLARYLVGEVDLGSIQTTCLHADDASGAANLKHLPPGMEEGLSNSHRVPRITASQWRFKAGAIGALMHAVALPGSKYESHIEVLMDSLRITLYEPYWPECKLLVRDVRSESDVVYEFGDDDPYETEMRTFLDAVRKRDASGIASSYKDAAQTYNFTWAVRRAGEEKH